MPRIEIIHAGQTATYSETFIKEICRHQSQAAAPSTLLTGRPSTLLIFRHGHVVKLRSEYQLPLEQARRFIDQAVSKEAVLAVHHPHKSWFLVIDDTTTKSVTIGNITPHLLPLNDTTNLLQQYSADERLQHFSALLQMYLQIAAKHDLTLDLNLSNFGLAGDHRLYYLDDEVYRWDEFGNLVDFLSSLIRSQDWMDSEFFQRLGAHLNKQLIKRFKDAHLATVISEQLKQTFIADDRNEQRSALIRGLYGKTYFHHQTIPKSGASTVALLADIHANAPALEVALDFIAKQQIATVLILGDIVGYGPHPNQCVSMLKAHPEFICIRGNHDHAVATGIAFGGVSSLAHWALNWTVLQIEDDAKHWLSLLPPFVQHENWLAVHGSPKDKTFFNGYVYQMNYSENLDVLQNRQLSLCFHGHTHIPKVYCRAKGVDYTHHEALKILPTASQALICPGSIGQPRGGQPGVELAIMNLDSMALEFVRLDYAMDTTIADMELMGFPPAMADRLKLGK